MKFMILCSMFMFCNTIIYERGFFKSIFQDFHILKISVCIMVKSIYCANDIS